MGAFDPAIMSDQETDTSPNKRSPKHMRLRYYTSYEEATIVKVWREHLSEITSYTENLAVFRDIAFALQQHNLRLNKQEVRRRISNYRTKYLAERGQLESDPQYKSEWRLYPLVDCMFQSASDKGTSTHIVETESKWIEDLESKLRCELPNLPHFNRMDCRTIKFDMDPNSCPFYEGPSVSRQVKAEMLSDSAQYSQQFYSPHVKTEIKDDLMAQSTSTIQGEKRSPLMPANRPLQSQQSPQPESACTVRKARRRSIMPRTGQITVAQIEQLRQENDLMAEQLDAQHADLTLKEREYLQLEQTFDSWLYQQETWVTYLDKRDIK